MLPLTPACVLKSDISPETSRMSAVNGGDIEASSSTSRPRSSVIVPMFTEKSVAASAGEVAGETGGDPSCAGGPAGAAGSGGGDSYFDRKASSSSSSASSSSSNASPGASSPPSRP